MPPTRPISHADMARHAAGLLKSGQLKAAERLLKDVLRAEPGQFDALLAYGVLCGMRGQSGEAVKHLARAVARRPDSDQAQYNLGQALIRLGRHAEAAEALQRAAGLADRSHIHEKLGDCLRQLGRLDEAVASFARAVALEPPPSGLQVGEAMLLSSLIETKRRICDWSGLAALEQRLAALVASGRPAEPLLLHYLGDDPDLHQRNAVAYWRDFLKPMLASGLPARPFVHRRHERKRLRIGYLCSDFRNHATSHLIAELIERHDHASFEIIALSFGPDDGSDMRRRLTAAFDRFVELPGLGSDEIAKRIHAAGIDILVDLNGYISNARPAILAARPAPIQCHYLAFPGTLGSDVIDYMIVDPVVVPKSADQDYTEALVRLPDCYQANDSKRSITGSGPSRSACDLPAGIVLCSFNNAIKLTPAMFAAWMRVLSAVPGSVLWLFSDNAWTPDNLRRAATAHGVDAARLVFAGYASPADHLARLRLADLFLDTFPYTAHTTASDALWLGLPVLTLAGRSFASRVGASLLHAVGLPELITTTIADYERTAIELARDPARLAALKTRLATQRATCPLFDTPRFTRHLEAAYLEMWARYSRGEPARGFDVAAT